MEIFETPRVFPCSQRLLWTITYQDVGMGFTAKMKHLEPKTLAFVRHIYVTGSEFIWPVKACDMMNTEFAKISFHNKQQLPQMCLLLLCFTFGDFFSFPTKPGRVRAKKAEI